MILSKRERYIAVSTIAVLGVLVLDRYVLTPLLAYSEQVQSRIAAVDQQNQRTDKLFQNSRLLRERWREMGALRSGGSSAESQVLHAVRDWAQDAGLNLSSVKPERNEQEKQFQKITFRAVGSGPMSAVSRFLWRVQTATIPARLTDVQITSRKDGADDLSVQLGISTIYLRPEAPKAPVAGTSGSADASGAVEAQ